MRRHSAPTDAGDHRARNDRRSRCRRFRGRRLFRTPSRCRSSAPRRSRRRASASSRLPSCSGSACGGLAAPKPARAAPARVMAAAAISLRKRSAEDQIIRERATTAREFDPAEIRHGQPWRRPAADWSGRAAAGGRRDRQSPDVAGRSAAPRFLVSGRGALGCHVAVGRGGRVVGGGRAAGRDRDAARRQPPAPAVTAREHGRRRQCLGAAGLERREPRRLRRGRGGDARLCGGARLGVVDRRRPARFARRRHQCAGRADRLGVGRDDDRARCARRTPICALPPSRASIPRSCIALP